MKNYQNKTKIVKVSKIIRNILFAGLVFWAIVGIAGLLAAVLVLIGHTKTHAIGSIFETGGSFLAIPFVFIVNLYFFKFFDRLKNGHLFDSQTTRYLEAAGKYLILLGIFQMLFAITAAAIFHPEHVTFSSGGIFSGLMTIFTAWLFREGQELQEEQELTI